MYETAMSQPAGEVSGGAGRGAAAGKAGSDLPIQPEFGEFLPQGREIAFEDSIIRCEQIQPLVVVRPDSIMCLQGDGEAESFREVASVDELKLGGGLWKRKDEAIARKR